jgi:hypothetical protein
VKVAQEGSPCGSEKDAWTQLGGLLNSHSELPEAAECFQNAFHLSKGLPNQGSNYARAMMGVTKGQQLLQQKMNHLGASLRQI